MTVEVSNIVLKYSALGAEKATMADMKLRTNVDKTAQHARKAGPAVAKWLKDEKAAILGIGLAMAAVLGAVIASSPLLRANLSLLQSDFSFLADEIGARMQPAFDLLDKGLMGAADLFEKLPGPAQDFIAAMISVGGVIGGIAVPVELAIKAMELLDISFVELAVPVLGLVAGLALIYVAFKYGGPIAGVLAIAVVALAAAWWFLDAAMAPVMLAILAITAVIVAIILVVQHWGDICKFFGDLWKNVWGAVGGAFTAVANVIMGIGRWLFDTLILGFGNMVKGAVDWGLRAIKNVGLGILAGAEWVWDGVKSIISGIGNFFGGMIGSALQWGEDMIKNIAKGIANAAHWVADAAGNVVDSIKHFLGFEVPANDTMAARWGTDLSHHFGKGLTSGFDQLNGKMAGLMPDLHANLMAPMPGAAPTPAPAVQPTSSPPTVIYLTFEKGSITNAGSGAATLDEDRLVEKVVKKVSTSIQGRATR